MTTIRDELSSLAVPLIQAPMGGISHPGLARAVAAAGAVGSVGLYRLTDRSDLIDIATALRGAPGRVAVGLVPELLPDRDTLMQITTVGDWSDDDLWWLTLGPVGTDPARALRRSGRRWVAQVGSVHDAIEVLDHGASAVIMQGVQAGGRLLGARFRDRLVRELRRRLPDAVIGAAGAITTADDLKQALQSGADFVCAGTLFVTSQESAAHPAYRLRLVRERTTTVTHAFSVGWSRPSRVLSSCIPDPNSRIARVGTSGGSPVYSHTPAVPTRDFSGDINRLALYAGTGVGGITEILPCSEIVKGLIC